MNTEKTYKLFNGQNYFIEVKMHNPDGDELILNPQSLLQLTIEDDLHFWPTRGFFVYENPHEIIERKMAPASVIPNNQPELKALKHYVFRNDGNDYLDVTIRPVFNNESELPIKNLPNEFWELKYKFVIYDKEDIFVNNITQKLKKFYFWDKDYQDMLSKNIQWSTATSDKNPAYNSLKTLYNPSLATDEQRKMTTGNAIKSILKDSGFSVDDKFDEGISKIFYTCFQDKNIWENIEYLLDQHVAQTTNEDKSPIFGESDICIFNKDRYTNKFELLPIHKIFANAGNTVNAPGSYQIEHLFFEENSESIISPYKAPISNDVSTTTDIKINKIKNYQYVDMSASDSTFALCTTPVHAYDFKNKTFSINIKNSNMDILENKLKKLYVENKLLTQNGAHVMLTLNNDKLNNKLINPQFSVRSDKEAIMKRGLGRLLYASLFLNGCISFNLEGATIRQAGRFVGIDRLTYSDNTLDYKLCGQWFITKVKHNFFHGMYNNELIGVKLHSHVELNGKKDV